MSKEDYFIKVSDLYNEVIILEKDKEHVKLKCPHCGKERIIKNDHLERRKNSLCANCSHKNITLFYIDNQKDCAYFYVKDKNDYIKVLIDYEDADRLFGKNFGISGAEKYIVILDSKNKRTKLTNFIMGHNFLDNKSVVDHINHDIYDNRRQNLRIINQTLNQVNKRLQKNNQTGFKGINWAKDRKGWKVQIRKNKQFVYNKCFKDFKEAYYHWHKNYILTHGEEYLYSIFNDKGIINKYAKINYFEILNGDGIGNTLFLQGCSNGCEGCYNKSTWDFNGGENFTEEVYKKLINTYFNIPELNRLTLCGGEPLQNLTISNYVAAEFKRLFPNKKLWIYTGLKYEDIKNDLKYKAILELCDVLVDGRFELDKRDLTLKWRGSSNQRVIDMQKTLDKGEIVLYCE